MKIYSILFWSFLIIFIKTLFKWKDQSNSTDKYSKCLAYNFRYKRHSQPIFTQGPQPYCYKIKTAIIFSTDFITEINVSKTVHLYDKTMLNTTLQTLNCEWNTSILGILQFLRHSVYIVTLSTDCLWFSTYKYAKCVPVAYTLISPKIP